MKVKIYGAYQWEVNQHNDNSEKKFSLSQSDQDGCREGQSSS